MAGKVTAMEVKMVGARRAVLLAAPHRFRGSLDGDYFMSAGIGTV
jgi:hypothetical protein